MADVEPTQDQQTPQHRQPPAGLPHPGHFGWILIVLGLWTWFFYSGLSGQETLSYSEFKDAVSAGQVVSCQVGAERIRGLVRRDGTSAKRQISGDKSTSIIEVGFQTVRVDDPKLFDDLHAAGVEVTGVRPSIWPQLILSLLLPLGLLALFWFYILKRAGGTGLGQTAMTFGKSRARLVADRDVKVSFRDVAGCDEAKAELAEVVDFLQHPDRFTSVGAKIPKGVLLVGPPGTGKTLLARAVAGEARVPFFSLSGSDFVEMFVGVGAARVRDLFQQAKQQAPCIVFIDELDAIGRARGVRVSNVNDEREHTLNQLLVEMDGFEDNTGVILLSATNRPDVLDAALLRPGRFDRQVVLDSPDAKGRREILEVHARNKPLAPDVNLDAVARATPGFSGADLANAINEAALTAARHESHEISQSDLEEAVEKVVAGPERRSRRLVTDEKRRVAYHEAGHAVVASLCPDADPVHKISIVPRGRAALGYTLQLPTGDQHLLTRNALFDRIRSLLGGRAAEELILGEVSTGAENDLEQATKLARNIVARFGMGDSVQLLHCATTELLATDPGMVGYSMRNCSERTAALIDEEAQQILDKCYGDSKRILEQHKDALERVSAALFERETLNEEDFRALLIEPIHDPASPPPTRQEITT